MVKTIETQEDDDCIQDLVRFKDIYIKRNQMELEHWEALFSQRQKTMGVPSDDIQSSRKNINQTLDLIQLFQLKIENQQNAKTVSLNTLQNQTDSTLAEELQTDIQQFTRRIDLYSIELKKHFWDFFTLAKEQISKEELYWKMMLENPFEVTRQVIHEDTVDLEIQGQPEKLKSKGTISRLKDAFTMKRRSSDTVNSKRLSFGLNRTSNLKKRDSILSMFKSTSPNPIEPEFSNDGIEAVPKVNFDHLQQKYELLKQSVDSQVELIERLANSESKCKSLEQQLGINTGESLNEYGVRVLSNSELERAKNKRLWLSTFRKCKDDLERQLQTCQSNETERLKSELYKVNGLIPLLQDVPILFSKSTAPVEITLKTQLNEMKPWAEFLENENKKLQFELDEKNQVIEKLEAALKTEKALHLEKHKSLQQETFPCIKDFKITKPDDLEMLVGDMVSISMAFIDGWCHGYSIVNFRKNHRTQQKGMFPLSNLYVPETDISRKSSVTLVESDQWNKSKTSKNSTTDEVLKNVTRTNTINRRMEYFNTLLSDSTSSEKTSEAVSKAKSHWAILQARWRDAVQKELSGSFEDWESRINRNAFWKLIVDNYRIEQGS